MCHGRRQTLVTGGLNRFLLRSPHPVHALYRFTRAVSLLLLQVLYCCFFYTCAIAASTGATYRFGVDSQSIFVKLLRLSSYWLCQQQTQLVKEVSVPFGELNHDCVQQHVRRV